MIHRPPIACCLLLALTCSCGTSNGFDASPNAASSGAGSGGQGTDSSGGSGAGAAAGGTGAGDSSGGSGGSTGGAGGSGAASGRGDSGGGDTSGGTSGSSTGGNSAGGSSTGGTSASANCAPWASDSWRSLPATDAPSAREEPWLIPTDDGMIVFGGYNHQTPSDDPFLDDGAIYRACDDTWTPMSTAGVPHAITDTVAQRPVGVWTGSELLAWGGFQSAAGGYEEGAAVSFASRYSAASDQWSDMQRDGEPTARDSAARLWIGDRLLVWGGVAQAGATAWVNHDDGALYDPKSDRWTAMSRSAAPAGRCATDRAVWTGKQLIVWGGLSYGAGDNAPVVTLLDDGGVYDAASDTWTPIATAGAPHGGLSPYAWTGSELIVISDLDGYSMPGQVLFEGARFDPTANRWSPLSAPSLDLVYTLENANLRLYWLGSVLAVFGERVTQGGSPALLLYDPQSDSWSSGTVPTAPWYFNWQDALVVGDRLVVIGPGGGSSDARGARHESTAVAVLDGKTRTWTNLPAALDRSGPGIVALPERIFAWGGKDIYTDLDAPNPCQGATGPCDPVTPTIQTLLADGVGISY